jgi:hypothetical protein
MKTEDQHLPQDKNKKPLYIPPTIESEEIFERRALACAKCRTGPHIQFACMRLPRTS